MIYKIKWRKSGCRARQITNGVNSDETAVFPRDIMRFFRQHSK